MRSRTPRTATIPNAGIPNPPDRRNDERGGFPRDQARPRRDEEPYSAYGDDSQRRYREGIGEKRRARQPPVVEASGGEGHVPADSL